MPAYSFVVRNNDAAGIKALGGMARADEGKALAFGKQVVRDLMREGAEQYAGWAMNVAEDARAVAGIPFDACPDQG